MWKAVASSLSALLALSPSSLAAEPPHEAFLGQNASEAGVIELAPCNESYSIAEVIEKAPEWCDVRWVPEQQRVPKKLQGLFWLKDLKLPDVAACFSRGIWDPEKLTIMLAVWDNFIYRESTSGMPFASAIFKADMHYLFEFKDETLSEASIHPIGAGLYTLPYKAFRLLADFPLIEMKDKEATPGDAWDRPSYAAGIRVDRYTAWRVLDGDLKVVQPYAGQMQAALEKENPELRIARYSTDCLSRSSCSRDTSTRCLFCKGETECSAFGLLSQCSCKPGHCASGWRCLPVWEKAPAVLAV